MRIHADFVLVGTGAAPLIAAHRLISEGRTVALVNPDRDFFLEDSEIGFDPFGIAPDRVSRSDAETTHSILSPFFPGPLELASHSPHVLRQRQDHGQPWVRPRARLWIRPALESCSRTVAEEWDQVEDFYLTANEHGFNPQILQGLAAIRRFPGFSTAPELLDSVLDTQAVLLPPGSDMDVERFRLGLHEFVAERVGPERILRGVSAIQLSPSGELDGHLMAGGGPCKLVANVGILVFWTAGTTPLVRRALPGKQAPGGGAIRLPIPESWEDWLFVSREPLNTEVIGWHEGGFVLAHVSGAPEGPRTLLRLVCPGNGSFHVEKANRLLLRFLRWRSFALRNLKSRTHFRWPEGTPALLWSDGKLRLLGRADGSMVEVAFHVKAACDRILAEDGGGANTA